MYVYIKSQPGLWTVGHYDPSDKWHPESDYSRESAAADRVAELNGGTKSSGGAGTPIVSPRAYFAAKAMQAMITQYGIHGLHPGIATEAFKMADAMLAAEKA